MPFSEIPEKLILFMACVGLNTWLSKANLTEPVT